jgi:hypothetical protein
MCLYLFVWIWLNDFSVQALLEKNEDLSKQNEKIAEEFSQKLEVSPP